MSYTKEKIIDFLDDGVNRNLMVLDRLAEDGELSIRLLSLLRQAFKKNYFKHPKYLLIDREYEKDIEFLAYQIQFLPQQDKIPVFMILGYNVIYVNGLNDISEQYQKEHLDVSLKFGTKSKLIIVRDDEINLFGVY